MPCLLTVASCGLVAGGDVKLSKFAVVNAADAWWMVVLGRVAVCALLVTAACGGTNSTNPGEQTLSDASGIKDGVLGDSKSDGTGSELGEDDLNGDAPLMDGEDGADAVSPADGATQTGDVDTTDATKTCEFAADPKPGEPGSTCKANKDCQSDLCVDGPQGRICTLACTDCCPTGFSCAPYGTGTGDQTFVCLPKVNALCQPCKADVDCGAFNSNAACVSYGGAGSFCGAPCVSGSDCPSGYTCDDIGITGVVAKQCVKSDKSCACSPAAISVGAETTCAVSSEFGVCNGTRKCDVSGLTACSAPVPAPESCSNGIDDNCDGGTDDEGALGCKAYFVDQDGDGTGASSMAGKCLCAPTGLYTATTATDCDDTTKAVNTGAKEICNDVDDDCDGLTDEGCDDDGDGWCDVNVVVIGAPAICVNGKKDCDDTVGAVHPGQSEQCGNGLDDDCDGLTDAGTSAANCVPFYEDSDGDGYGTVDSICQCAATGLYTAVKSGDCDDKSPGVHPNGTEVCSNGKDDNCDGVQDEANAQGCSDYYVDLDADGYGVATPTCLCAPTSELTALSGGDCNDAVAVIHPNAVETCDGIDNNCFGGTDEEGAEGCATLFADQDGDKYGDPKKSGCVCGPNAAYSVTDSTDCNDAQATANPAATETCDGIDNDCDGLADEADADGCQVYFADGDADGFGDTAEFACLCKANPTYKVSKLGDCKDNDPSINPGAKEVCDGIDNNCTGTIDENGAQGCSTFFYDNDQDGYGLDSASECLCAKAGFYTATIGGDCVDTDSAVHPRVTEVCDGLDNDCDGTTDPANSSGCSDWFVDKDGDGYGNPMLASKCLCGAINGYANKGGDCNDNDTAINPLATEICNGKDDNCDGIKDPKGTQGCTTFYADGDNDGYGVSSLSQCACTADTLFKATAPADCNDGNPSINPGANEVCNQLDDNCNSQTDEGLLKSFYQDADGDGWGGIVSNIQCAADAAYSSSTSGDCDDAKFAVNPGATEICNYTDDNCDGQTDEGTSLTTYYKDLDGDTFGAGLGQQLCSASGQFSVTDHTDCDDAKYAVHPGAPDVCDGVDNNCNGQIDENLPTGTYFTDADKDGYGTGGGATQCGPFGTSTASVGGDCNDGSANVYPSAAEICDALDNNCDGTIDEGYTKSTYFPDLDGDGYGTGSGVLQCSAGNGNTAIQGGDCNDSNGAVSPGKTEVCGNGVDDNCNAQIDENCTPKCGDVQFNFEAGTAPGWTLGAGWNVGAWAGANGVGKGLGYGTGTNYPAATSTANTAFVQLYVPAGATTIQFDYRYSPDPAEVSFDQANIFTGYDQITIGLGTYTSAWTRDAYTGPVAWTHFTFTGVPAAWGGTYQKFALSFLTKDTLDNAGFGYAIDNISVNCN